MTENLKNNLETIKTEAVKVHKALNPDSKTSSWQFSVPDLVATFRTSLIVILSLLAEHAVSHFTANPVLNFDRDWTRDILVITAAAILDGLRRFARDYSNYNKESDVEPKPTNDNENEQSLP